MTTVKTALPRLRDLPRSAWRVAILAGMASYLDAGSIITSGGALVLYKNHFGITLGQIGELSAMLTFLFAIGALIGGRLGDRRPGEGSSDIAGRHGRTGFADA